MSATIMGQRHWQAPDQLQITREPGFGNRYIRKADVERRLDEGWEIVESPLMKNKEGGTSVDRAQHYRGLILMRMPLPMIEERNAHYQNLHKRRLRAVARGAHMTSISRARTSEGTTTEDDRPLAGTIGKGLYAHQGVHTDDGLTHTDNIAIPVDAHPDDIREDMEVVREMQEEKTNSQKDEEEAPKTAAPSKSKPKVKRR